MTHMDGLREDFLIVQELEMLHRSFAYALTTVGFREEGNRI